MLNYGKGTHANVTFAKLFETCKTKLYLMVLRTILPGAPSRYKTPYPRNSP